MNKQTVVHGSIKNQIVASDLLEERAKADFDPRENNAFTDVFNVDYFKKEIDLKNFLLSDPVLRNSHKFYEMTREEMWVDHMKKARRCYELAKDKYFVEHKTGDPLWYSLLLGQNMTGLHQSMFVIALENTCSDEQLAKWYLEAKNMRMMGCYAQTEIGHGSNVAGLETTATFDGETDEFVIHTPSISATKWWPGDMGNFASHAVVYAQLIIEENNYGVMPFLVQLRSTEDFMPMKGIQCGDLGPKMGYTSKNNGWCQFDHVRIPRTQMLMKYTSVDRDGGFAIEGDTRALYSVMVRIRIWLLLLSGQGLLRSCLIGIRYSAVRRQFKNTEGSRSETKLLDYQTQQQKLLPLMAQGYSFLIAYDVIYKKYGQLMEDVKSSKFTLLDEIHHLSSGMKAVFTQTTFEGLCVVRQACGGAGYTAWSGLPFLIDDHSPNVTLEGDNTVMAQQSFRFLQKMYKKAFKGEPLPSPLYTYIGEIKELIKMKCSASADFCDPEQIKEALTVCSAYLLESVMNMIAESTVSKKKMQNETLALDIERSSAAHIRYITYALMLENLDRIECPKLRGHFRNLTILAGLSFLKNCHTAGFESGYFSAGSQVLVEGAFNKMLALIRPQAVPLAELMANSVDDIFPTAIGNKYGDIYETHVEWAKTSRLNDPANGSIPNGFKDYLLPILKGKL